MWVCVQDSFFFSPLSFLHRHMSREAFLSDQLVASSLPILVDHHFSSDTIAREKSVEFKEKIFKKEKSE